MLYIECECLKKILILWWHVIWKTQNIIFLVSISCLKNSQSSFISGTAINNFCETAEINVEKRPKYLLFRVPAFLVEWMNRKYTGKADKIMAIPIEVSKGFDIIGRIVIMAVNMTYMVGNIKWTCKYTKLI